MSKAVLARPLVLALAVAGGIGLTACAPAVPDAPTFTRDVQPIFEAHCVRCHDETLRSEILPNGMTSAVPITCHLNRFAGTGDCTPAGITAGSCSWGASQCANVAGQGSYLQVYLFPMSGAPLMPLAPAPALNSWENDVVRKWITQLDANGAPTL